MKNNKITVQEIPITIISNNEEDYICISDIAKAKVGKSKTDDIIKNWLRNRNTLEFLGTWETMYNYKFKSVEFDGFKKESELIRNGKSKEERFNILTTIANYQLKILNSNKNIESNIVK